MLTGREELIFQMFSDLRLALSFRVLRSKNLNSHGFILARAQQTHKDSPEQRGRNKRMKVALSEQRSRRSGRWRTGGRADGRTGSSVHAEVYQSVTSDRCSANVRDD